MPKYSIEYKGRMAGYDEQTDWTGFEFTALDGLDYRVLARDVGMGDTSVWIAEELEDPRIPFYGDPPTETFSGRSLLDYALAQLMARGIRFEGGDDGE